jgi:hypothetical protein
MEYARGGRKSWASPCMFQVVCYFKLFTRRRDEMSSLTARGAE